MPGFLFRAWTSVMDCASELQPKEESRSMHKYDVAPHYEFTMCQRAMLFYECQQLAS